MEKQEDMICAKCGVPLQLIKTRLTYLGFNTNYELPRCPVCGQVYISEELANGKMRKLELSLEDK